MPDNARISLEIPTECPTLRPSTLSCMASRLQTLTEIALAPTRHKIQPEDLNSVGEKLIALNLLPPVRENLQLENLAVPSPFVMKAKANRGSGIN